MFGLEILDVAIGLIFVYLVMSLICTAIRELGASLTNVRADALEKKLQSMLGSDADAFFNQPLIASLHEKNDRVSYMPSRTFVQGVMNVMNIGGVTLQTTDAVRQTIELHGNDRLKSVMLPLLDDAHGDIEKFKTNIEDWFNASMDRLSAWFKRQTQFVIFAIAVVVAAAVNVDTIAITTALSQDSALREALVAQAQQIAKDSEPGVIAADQIEGQIRKLQTLGVPLGWTRSGMPNDYSSWTAKVLGLALSAFAFSLGAPFWFDMLKRLITIRANGDSPDEKKPGS